MSLSSQFIVPEPGPACPFAAMYIIIVDASLLAPDKERGDTWWGRRYGQDRSTVGWFSDSWKLVHLQNLTTTTPYTLPRHDSYCEFLAMVLNYAVDLAFDYLDQYLGSDNLTVRLDNCIPHIWTATTSEGCMAPNQRFMIPSPCKLSEWIYLFANIGYMRTHQFQVHCCFQFYSLSRCCTYGYFAGVYRTRGASFCETQSQWMWSVNCTD